MNNNSKSNLKMYLAAIGTCLFWGSSFPFMRYISAEEIYSPSSIMFLRFLVASIVLLVVNKTQKSRLPDKKDLPLIFLSGFLGIFLYTWAFNIASVNVLSGVSSFIISSTPIFTLLLSMVFLKERPSKQALVGLFLSFTGLFLISFTELVASNFSIDIIFLICCAVLTSSYNILQRKVLLKYNALEAVSYSVFAATLAMFIFLPSFATEAKDSTLSVNLAIVYLGVFPAAAAYYLWNLALSLAEDTATITAFQYSVPFISIILAYFWLGESITMLAFVGGIVIIFGMFVSNKQSKKA